MSLKDLALAFLREEGYKFEELSNEVIRFRSEGMILYCETPTNDDEFIRFILPAIHSLSDKPEVSLERIMSTCNTITKRMKVLKVYLGEDNDVVHLSADLFVEKGTQNLSSIIPRILNLLSQGRRLFYESL